MGLILLLYSAIISLWSLNLDVKNITEMNAIKMRTLKATEQNTPLGN